ncbi:MAG: slipin family protein [Methanoregulaceae archaeon]|jgi:regulator of protease activity HflC (stomatin/prohibitin superfamily)|nr:slipin family protein [Methanoregulaceae archaeon]
MAEQHPMPYIVFLVLVIPALWMLYTGITDPTQATLILAAIVWIIIVAFISASVKIADQWERAIILRLGKFTGLKGPGIFYIVPIVEKVAYWIDNRVITTSFKAEKTLTKDTVPVDVEAVLFWKVLDPVKAALEVEDYRSAISWASQTALREVIGKSFLSDMLEGREKIDIELQKIIDRRTIEWGVHVSSVEIRDVLIPNELQDAMSMQAQAERERQARVILGDSERQVAAKFEEAAKTYQNNPVALHLRAMNMLYEGLKEKATLVIVPSTVLNTMTLGDMTGTVSLAKMFAETEPQQKKVPLATNDAKDLRKKSQADTPSQEEGAL